MVIEVNGCVVSLPLLCGERSDEQASKMSPRSLKSLFVEEDILSEPSDEVHMDRTDLRSRRAWIYLQKQKTTLRNTSYPVKPQLMSKMDARRLGSITMCFKIPVVQTVTLKHGRVCLRAEEVVDYQMTLWEFLDFENKTLISLLLKKDSK